MNILIYFIAGISILSLIAAGILIWIKLIQLGQWTLPIKVLLIGIVIYALQHFIIKYW